MGDAILGAVVDVTLSKVISVATEQLNLAVGFNFKQELKKFRVVLNMVRGVLQDAEQKKVMGHCDLKPWLEELRSIADEAEDVMDEIAYENLRRKVAAQTDQNQMWRRKVGYCFTLCKSNPLIFRNRMAKSIKDLNSDLAQLNDWATGLGLQHRLSNNIPQHREQQQTDSSLGDPSQVIGREGDAQKIVQLLIDSSNDDQPPRVLSIVGVAGLGKTTLAKLVCNDQKVQRHFFKIIWVCVSGHFYMKSILGEMLESLTKRKYVANQDAMVKKLKEKLEGKIYLLVLDDVWNEDRQKWEELKNLLLGISKKVGSRVLVTTRNHNVASMMGSLVEIEQLNVDHCWSIIKQKAFGNSAFPSKLGHIGREIAEKCNGVPLVASVVGGTLSNNRNKYEWLSVKEKIGAWGSLEVDNYNAILRVSQLSFDRLPTPALKQCFAFCSIFPKNFVMEREMLIQLWMAEGFLQGLDSSIEMEDIGDQYFSYLLSCSFFQDVERDSCGSIITCKMHDLMHDLAKSVSKFETLILENGSTNNFSNNIRHLNLIYGAGMATTDVRDVTQKLRTLFSNVGIFGNMLINSERLLQASSFYGVERLPQAPSFYGADIDDMIVNLKRLRVLSFCGAKIDRLPALLGKLKHLKYLDVSETRIKELPKFITKFYQLQTFRFMDCVYVERPLEGIENLVNLRYIYFNNKEHMPAGIGSLTCLRTLLLFVVEQKKGRGIEELGCLSKLRGRLIICNLEKVGNKVEAIRAKLSEKIAIHRLALEFGKEDGDEEERGKHDEDVLEGLKPHSNLKQLTIIGYYGENSPLWLSKTNGSLGESTYLKNLFSLNIISCYRLKRLPRISGLPSLRILELRHCPKMSGIGDSNSCLFHSLCLEELTLYDCPDLISMPLDGLSSLQKIYIYSCGQLKSIGETLSASTRLKDLTIEYCPDLTYVPSLHGLSSLQSLRIACCGGLTSLPIGLSSCTALEELTIEHCHDMISIPEDLRSIPEEESLCFLARLKVVSITYISEELQEFPDVLLQPSLEELTLIGWKKLKHLPHRIQHLTALITLWIQEFHELEALPDWLGNLSSLQSLRILFCKSLMHLPAMEAMQCLSKLDSLEISGCLELQLKCDRRSGSEWDKISHIPTIIIGWEWIQDRGASSERHSVNSHYDDDESQIAITPASASANYDADEGHIAITPASASANCDDDESQSTT